MAVSEAQSLEEGYQHTALEWEQDRVYNSCSCDIQFCVATHRELHPFPSLIPIGQKRAGEIYEGGLSGQKGLQLQSQQQVPAHLGLQYFSFFFSFGLAFWKQGFSV